VRSAIEDFFALLLCDAPNNAEDLSLSRISLASVPLSLGATIAPCFSSLLALPMIKTVAPIKTKQKNRSQ